MTKCKVNAYRSAKLIPAGEKRQVLPIAGSVDGKGETGTCPECLTPGVLLSIVGGFVRAHTVSTAALPENNPQPATLVEAPGKKPGKFFSEQMLPVADTGSAIGDPRSAIQRRTAEIDGAYEHGTVKVPQKGDKGRTKLTDVPATAENVRKALDYWKSRKPRTDTSRKAQSEHVSTLTRQLGAMGMHKAPVYSPESKAYTTERRALGKVAMTAAESPEGRTAHVLPGPALVQGPNMAPVQKMWRNPVTGETEVAAARLDGALTERLDRTVADERPQPHRTASQRRNWRRKQARLAAGKNKG